ncbi:MAG: hypothetical protein PHU91_02985 [Candidatus Omnitrophica bacterium]|nr:hypothetical protein [Candidatus Omnitrophota bacterium]MDD5236606.1 hypothetical protein [Candidatus Omnitrophota bacterium]MDD5610437.1 hypothetical protein [Candidatus Omnitrophota bacterium]
MDKKELYEHLARIYLDSSKKHQRKKKKHDYLIESRHLYIGIAVFILLGAALLLLKADPFHKKMALSGYRTALVIQPDAIKINYNFDAAKKEIYNLPLKGLDLTTYKALVFAVRRVKNNSNGSLRIEIVNSLNEKSETYIKDIPFTWKEYKIELSSLKKITDWSGTKELLFIAEEWNTKDKNDVIYIDNVRFLK